GPHASRAVRGADLAQRVELHGGAERVAEGASQEAAADPRPVRGAPFAVGCQGPSSSVGGRSKGQHATERRGGERLSGRPRVLGPDAPAPAGAGACPAAVRSRGGGVRWGG